MKKTYASRGLIEWQMALNVCGALLRFKFTGGSMGSNGIIPAKYTTDNEAIQKLIESSDYFKSGRVYLCQRFNDRDDSSSDSKTKSKR